jgi:mannose-1-phosphate guanylyltransferase/mannose-1-phosphate guanylyltransferase/phosphomannomutase
MAMNVNVTKAMILAAGEGTRLKPLTHLTPKTLLPINGTRLILYILSWLKRYGVREIAINIHHLGDQIESCLGDGSQLGMEILYSREQALLGTAGGVKKMADFFDSAFIVIHGDMLVDFDLSAMVRFHRENKAIATIVLAEVPNPWEYGIVKTNDSSRIVSFVEKPLRGTEQGNLSNGGIYVLEREVLNYIPAQGFCDFGSDIFPKLLELGLPVYGYILKPGDYLIDIGTMIKYHKANEDVKARRVKVFPFPVGVRCKI